MYLKYFIAYLIRCFIRLAGASAAGVCSSKSIAPRLVPTSKMRCSSIAFKRYYTLSI